MYLCELNFLLMFRRQTREPFPIRNIIAFSVIVLIVLLFVLQEMKKAETPAPANQPLLIEQGE